MDKGAHGDDGYIRHLKSSEDYWKKRAIKFEKAMVREQNQRYGIWWLTNFPTRRASDNRGELYEQLNKRAEVAEIENKRLREALEEIADGPAAFTIEQQLRDCAQTALAATFGTENNK